MSDRSLGGGSCDLAQDDKRCAQDNYRCVRDNNLAVILREVAGSVHADVLDRSRA